MIWRGKFWVSAPPSDEMGGLSAKIWFNYLLTPHFRSPRSWGRIRTHPTHPRTHRPSRSESAMFRDVRVRIHNQTFEIGMQMVGIISFLLTKVQTSAVDETHAGK